MGGAKISRNPPASGLPRGGQRPHVHRQYCDDAVQKSASHHDKPGAIHGAPVSRFTLSARHDRHLQSNHGLLLALVGCASVGRRGLGADYGCHPGLPPDQTYRRRSRSHRKMALCDCRPHVFVRHSRDGTPLLLYRNATVLVVDWRTLQRPGTPGILRYGGIRRRHGATQRPPAPEHAGAALGGRLCHYGIRWRWRLGLCPHVTTSQSLHPWHARHRDARPSRVLGGLRDAHSRGHFVYPSLTDWPQALRLRTSGVCVLDIQYWHGEHDRCVCRRRGHAGVSRTPSRHGLSRCPRRVGGSFLWSHSSH